MIRIIKYIICLLTFYHCQLNLIAQQNIIDSLLVIIKLDKADANKLLHLNKLSSEYINIGSYDDALFYSNYALQLSNDILKITANPTIKRKIQKCQVFSLKMIGLMYFNKCNYPEALKNHFACLKLSEDIGYLDGIGKSYNDIGVVYTHQGNYDEALKFHFASLKIKEKFGDKNGIANSYKNIGNIYNRKRNYPEALKNYFASLKIDEVLGNQKKISASYQNIGMVYNGLGNYPEALKNYFKSFTIIEEIGINEDKVRFYLLTGQVYLNQKKYKEAKDCFLKAKELSKAMGSKLYLKDSYSLLTELDSANHNYKGAYENHKLYILYRDSIDNETTRKKIVQTQMTYDFEKKEAATQAEQNKKDIIANEELTQKEQQRNYFIIGFALVALLSLFVLRGYNQKKKANIIITQQKQEVEKSKHIIEEKNKDITDSINYAKRIQHAMLPHVSDIWAAFPQSFVLFKPKDIVSGDFYFFHKNNQSNFIAAADCTGHGVPGAFMSMIGAGKLNDAVSQSSDLSEILSLLNIGIKTALKQTDNDNSTRDGMDIALCSINTENRIVRYAGANRPLWIIRKGTAEVEETKATKTAIGGLTKDNQHFASHEIKLLTGDTIYICTDGFADQFSGHDGKKLMTKKFKEILLHIQDKSMKEQEQYLGDFIENWKAGTEQLDDILVIGVRL